MTRLLLTSSSLSFLMLSACGSADTPPAPAPSNSPPVFAVTGAVDVQTAENVAANVYSPDVTDPDGDSLTFTIGGNDAALFSIDGSSGELSFASAPDFERPEDANTDNVYEVIISAADGRGGAADQTLRLTVTNVDQSFQIKRVGTGFNLPLYLTDLPGVPDRVLVLEKEGRIRILNTETGLIDSVDFLDLSNDVNVFGEGGLLGLAFAPDYASSGEFYVNVTATDEYKTEIRRYALQAGRSDIADPLSKDIVLTFDQPRGNHNAGWIGFDANGLLVIPMGDGGGAGDPQNLAQNPQTLLGKVIRIDVSADDFPTDADRDYAIPAGNTYTNASDGLPEIFATGFRNPFRSSFDPQTGDLLIGDVGQNAAEEVSRLPMDNSGLNFGWRIKEGTQDFVGTTTATLTPPVAEYLHGTGPREGRSITGGYVYTGPVEALQDEYIFADFISGNVWSLPVNDLRNGTTISSAEFTVLTDAFISDQGPLVRISSFGLDGSANLYITTIGGDVYRLEAAD